MHIGHYSIKEILQQKINSIQYNPNDFLKVGLIKKEQIFV